jgi:hypothetical protein
VTLCIIARGPAQCVVRQENVVYRYIAWQVAM